MKAYSSVTRLLVLAIGAVGSLSAQAQSQTTCADVISSYKSYVQQNLQANADAYKASHPECFGGSGNQAIAAKQIQATTLDQMLAVSAGASSRSSSSAPPGTVVADAGTVRGMAAGGKMQQWNWWGNISQTNQKYDRGIYQLTTAGFTTDRTNKYSNRIQNAVLGFDYLVSPDVALGLSGAWDNGSGSAESYTIAAPTAAKNVSTSGYSWAPYLAWQINKDWSLDFSAGTGKGKSRMDNAIKTDSKRSFYGLNLAYTGWFDRWQITGKGGYLFGQEKAGDSVDDTAGTLVGTAVTNKVGQTRLGVQAAYWADGVMPYIGLAYIGESRSSNASADQKIASEMGTNAAVWSLGLNFISVKNGVTGGIGYEKETGRSHSKNDKVMANISFRY